MKNIPTIKDVFDGNVNITELSVDMIYELTCDCTDEKNMAVTVDALLKAELASRYHASHTEKGVAHVTDGQYKVSMTNKETVSWDNDYLSDNFDANWVSVKFSIPESKWKAMPDGVKSKFQEARTVKPAKPTISIQDIL